MTDTKTLKPIKADLQVELARVHEVTACLAGMPNPMHRNLDELWLFEDVGSTVHDIRFEPKSSYQDERCYILQGRWRARTTAPGETWEPGCVFISRDSEVVLYTPALLFAGEVLIELLRAPDSVFS